MGCLITVLWIWDLIDWECTYRDPLTHSSTSLSTRPVVVEKDERLHTQTPDDPFLVGGHPRAHEGYRVGPAVLDQPQRSLVALDDDELLLPSFVLHEALVALVHPPQVVTNAFVGVLGIPLPKLPKYFSALYDSAATID